MGTNQNKNTQPKHFGARFVIVLLFVYIFSVFSSHLPTYPPAHKCSTRPAQMRAKKTANPHFIFLIQKNSFAPKILIKTKNSKQDIFKFEAPNLTLYKNTKKSF